jgi:hypothetical protein
MWFSMRYDRKETEEEYDEKGNEWEKTDRTAGD